MRKLAVMLALVALAEITGILLTPTHEKELSEAVRRYELARQENVRLRRAVFDANSLYCAESK